MADMSKHIDLGGNTLIVSGINIASKPGQVGTPADLGTGGDVSSDELTLTGGATDVVITGTTAAAGTGAGSAGNTGGAVATNVLSITVNGTPFYIPLCSTNA